MASSDLPVHALGSSTSCLPVSRRPSRSILEPLLFILRLPGASDHYQNGLSAAVSAGEHVPRSFQTSDSCRQETSNGFAECHAKLGQIQKDVLSLEPPSARLEPKARASETPAGQIVPGKHRPTSPTRWPHPMAPPSSTRPPVRVARRFQRRSRGAGPRGCRRACHHGRLGGSARGLRGLMALYSRPAAWLQKGLERSSQGCTALPQGQDTITSPSWYLMSA